MERVASSEAKSLPGSGRFFFRVDFAFSLPHLCYAVRILGYSTLEFGCFLHNAGRVVRLFADGTLLRFVVGKLADADGFIPLPDTTPSEAPASTDGLAF